MESHQDLKAEDVEKHYQCVYSDDKSSVDMTLTGHRLEISRLTFGDSEEHPGPPVEQCRIRLKAPIMTGNIVLAMADMEIFCLERQIFARPRDDVQKGGILRELARHIGSVTRTRKSIAMSRASKPRGGLDGMMDEIERQVLSGDVISKGQDFIQAFHKKTLANGGDHDETLLLAITLRLFREDRDARSIRQKEADDEERPEKGDGDAGE